MAIIGKPVLTITGSSTVGSSEVTASYPVTFDEFDQASDQPYREVVKLFGVDAGEPGAGPDDLLGTIFPSGIIVFGSDIVRASQVIAPATGLTRTHTATFKNNILDEDQTPILNPDELRAEVTLTPISPVAVTRSSDTVKISL
jgi:hypothetical protein